uniref:Uncharacterized protein n=1 Tax=Oryza punctata TaxID=4537 RepID=A0A0E0LZG5_ORYPU
MSAPDPSPRPVYACITHLVDSGLTMYMVAADYLRHRIAQSLRENWLYTDHHDAMRTHPDDLNNGFVEHMVTASLCDGVDAVIDLLAPLPLFVDPN